MATSTIQVNFESLQSRGASAATVIKLMMACNDLVVVNQSLGEWKDRRTAGDRSIRKGAGMYFQRAQIAHLYEAFAILESIRKDDSLMAVIASCDLHTRECFAGLQTFMLHGGNRGEFERLIGQVRNNLTHHYDEKSTLTSRAVEDRAKRPEGRWGLVTRGDNMRRWEFQVADDIVDSIIVRQIWKAPKEVDVRRGADEAGDRIHAVFLQFLDFAGEFIWRYCRGD